VGCVAGLLLWLAPPAASAALTDSVDPLIGTAGSGLVAPGATLPFGMVQNSPDTLGAIGGGGYQAGTGPITGFSLLHLSGAGVKSEGDLPFMPVVGFPGSSDDRARFASGFDPAGEQAAPGYYRVHLSSGIDVELTATTRTAAQRYTFPPSASSSVVIDAAQSMEGRRRAHLSFSRHRTEVSGTAVGRYPVYFVARFDRPFAHHGGFRSGHERAAGGWVGFDTRQNRSVTVRVGVSFVNLAHARMNLDREAGRAGFDALRASAQQAWEQALGTVQVSGGSDAQRTTFYSALYRALQYPNVFSDVDGAYRGYDNLVHWSPGHVQYSDFSAWDSYRAQDQLIGWLFPGRYQDIMLSLLNDYRQGGRLPRWGEKNLDPDYQFGDPSIPMIADGVCTGLVPPSAERGLLGAALDLVRRRPPEFAQLGYVPGDVSRTLELGVDDFALALIADRLGRGDVAGPALLRSLAYRNVIDPDTGWARPRLGDGSWLSPFQPDGTAGFFESNSYRNTWLAAHDARGLFTLMGGYKAVVDRLDDILSVHPMLYGRDNEEDMQVPWMYAFAGAAWRGDAVLRSLQGAFYPARDGIPGNDDLGGLSAGRVLSGIGLGPVTAGAPFWVVGSPEFPQVVVSPQGGAPFTISAPSAVEANPYVRAASLNGIGLGRAWVYDREVRGGGRLDLDMGDSPNTDWASSPDLAPPSVSDSPIERFGCRR
jgi:predicted alpha-1,2-mannosidase